MNGIITNFSQGIEIVPLNSQALLGKEMALQCHSRLPFKQLVQERSNFLFDLKMEWFWTPQGSQLEHHLESLDSFKQLTGNQIISRTD